MVSPKPNTKNSSNVNIINAVSAIKMLANSRSGLQSITTTSAESYGDCCAPTVIIGYSDGTEVVISLDGWPTISTEELQAGLYLPK
jgi:predicted esterase